MKINPLSTRFKNDIVLQFLKNEVIFLIFSVFLAEELSQISLFKVEENIFAITSMSSSGFIYILLIC